MCARMILRQHFQYTINAFSFLSVSFLRYLKIIPLSTKSITVVCPLGGTLLLKRCCQKYASVVSFFGLLTLVDAFLFLLMNTTKIDSLFYCRYSGKGA